MVGDAFVVNPGSPYKIEKRDRYKIKNLVMFDGPQPSENEMWCRVCNKKRVLMTKEELLRIGLSDSFNQRVSEKCNGDQSYAYCEKCCGVLFEPASTSIVPADWTHAVTCVHCIQTNDKKHTYAPKFMYENPEDENKQMRMGEPVQLSQKKWYWHCSNCNHREPMLQSALKKTYHTTEHKTWLQTIGTSKKPSGLGDEEPLPPGARLIDEHTTPAPGY